MKKEFSELVGESLGRASMAWSKTPEGIFDSDTCSCLHIDIMNAHNEEIRELKDRLKDAEESLKKITTDISPPWDPLDVKQLSRSHFIKWPTALALSFLFLISSCSKDCRVICNEELDCSVYFGKGNSLVSNQLSGMDPIDSNNFCIDYLKEKK